MAGIISMELGRTQPRPAVAKLEMAQLRPKEAPKNIPEEAKLNGAAIRAKKRTQTVTTAAPKVAPKSKRTPLGK